MKEETNGNNNILHLKKEEYLRKKEVLTSFFSDKSYVAMSKKQIANILGVKKEDKKILEDILNELEEEGKIYSDSSNRYYIVDGKNVVVCTYIARNENYAVINLDDGRIVHISKYASKGAMNNDIVLIKVYKKGNNLEGEVVQIIKRNIVSVIGRFQKSNNFGFVEPIDKKISDIYIPKKEALKCKNEQMVEVEITKYPTDNNKAEGIITKIIGSLKDENIEVKALYRYYGLDQKENFNKEVLKEVNSIPSVVSEIEKKNRVDRTSDLVVTIDGDDAKDLDDAVCVKKDKDDYLLSVFIADVSYYVKSGTALDKEAIDRGTSTYIPGTVIPMLPKELSNGICSLNEGVDRLTLAIDMRINSKGEVMDSNIYKAVIKVSKRMTYDKVYKVLTNSDINVVKEYSKYIEELSLMKELALILNNKRMSEGSINFDIKETKIVLDENRKVVCVKPYDITIANKIIEEFMLVANMTIAEKFYFLEAPFIYRIHEKPDEERLRDLNEILASYHKKIKALKNIHPKTLSDILSSITDEEEKQVVSSFMLRTLKLARYSEECIGHFGLSAKYYCHFTSPIRRYPDLFIHRVISDYISNNYLLSDEKYNKYLKQAKLYSKSSSEAEKLSTLIERDFDNLYEVMYMSKYIGSIYNAIIVQVASFGMFVQLNNTVEGFVSFEDMPYYDYYIFNDKKRMLVGENTKEVFKIGDKVVVKLIRCNIRSKQIDFRIIKRGIENGSK